MPVAFSEYMYSYWSRRSPAARWEWQPPFERLCVRTDVGCRYLNLRRSDVGELAMGRLNILIAPTITITMEITMATMGRLIKNFGHWITSLAFDGKRLGGDLHA